MVERRTGEDLHGRHGVPRSRRRARGPCDPFLDAVAVDRPRRSLRPRDDVGHHADHRVPRLPHAGIPNGAAPSSFRARRLAGIHRHRSILDHRGARRCTRTRPVLRRLPREGWRAMNLSGRAVVVLGLARSGEAAARALLAAGANVTVVDQSDEEAQRERAARIAGARIVLGRIDERDLDGAELVVASPGVPPHSPWWKAADAAGIPVWSEIECAFQLGVHPAIAITGTNGKTTTTEMTTAALIAAGIDATAAGNIGAPLVDAPAGVIVAEVSSFQLHAISEFRAPVAVLLNAAQDHLDWHGTFDAYVAD